MSALGRLFDVPTMAVTDWPSNGHLIEACVDLGYLSDAAVVLDDDNTIATTESEPAS